MNPSQCASAIRMLNVLRDDIAHDVSRREGLPLTGPNVATALGEICAQVDAIARVLLRMLEEEA